MWDCPFHKVTEMIQMNLRFRRSSALSSTQGSTVAAVIALMKHLYVIWLWVLRKQLFLEVKPEKTTIVLLLRDLLLIHTELGGGDTQVKETWYPVLCT